MVRMTSPSCGVAAFNYEPWCVLVNSTNCCSVVQHRDVGVVLARVEPVSLGIVGRTSIVLLDSRDRHGIDQFASG